MAYHCLELSAPKKSTHKLWIGSQFFFDSVGFGDNCLIILRLVLLLH